MITASSTDPGPVPSRNVGQNQNQIRLSFPTGPPPATPARAQAAARSGSWATPSRSWRCRSSPTRPPSRSSARSRPTAPSPFAATTTRSRPAWSGRPSLPAPARHARAGGVVTGRGGAGQPSARPRRRRPHPAAAWACRRAGTGRAGRVHHQAALPAQGQPLTRSPSPGGRPPGAPAPPRARRGDRRPGPLRRARRRRPMSTQTTTSAYQQLRGHLHSLRLEAAAEALPAALDHARAANLSHTAFLEHLLGIEVTATQARRQQSRLRFAAFPAPWRLEDFDFDAQPAVDRALVGELATLRFIDKHANVLLIGPPGVGNSFFAVAPGTLTLDPALHDALPTP